MTLMTFSGASQSKNQLAILVTLSIFQLISILFWGLPIAHSNSRYLNDESLAGIFPTEESLIEDAPPIKKKDLMDLLPERKIKSKHRDFGGIEFTLLPKDRFRRRTDVDNEIVFAEYRDELLSEIDDEEHEWLSKDDPDDSSCEFPEYAGNHYFNCNAFHEIDFGRPRDDQELHQKHDVKRLSKGYYREAWLVKDKMDHDKFVIKRTRWHERRNFDSLDYFYTDIDALVMERLTASPYVMDIHGYCGGSVAVEAMKNTLRDEVFTYYKGFIPKPGKLDLRKVLMPPQNKLSPERKLELALSISQGMASIHGFEGGMIVHSDISNNQWMLDSNGNAKLGDFNKATLSRYNKKKNKYCKFRTGMTGGIRRSPEEYERKRLTDRIDVYSLGNMFYNILMGLSEYYHLTYDYDEDEFKDEILNKKLPIVNHDFSNSYPESRLLEITYKCWTFDPEKRIDVFGVVKELKAAIEETKKQKFLDGVAPKRKPKHKRHHS